QRRVDGGQPLALALLLRLRILLPTHARLVVLLAALSRLPSNARLLDGLIEPRAHRLVEVGLPAALLPRDVELPVGLLPLGQALLLATRRRRRVVPRQVVVVTLRDDGEELVEYLLVLVVQSCDFRGMVG